MKRTLTIILTLALSLLVSETVLAGPTLRVFKKHKKKNATAVVATNPAPQQPPQMPKKGVPQPYASVIKPDFQSQRGFITVHYSKNDDRYFFEIPDTLMGRDLLFVNRVANAYADMRNGNKGYSGDQIGQSVYRFERGHANRLYLKRISFSEYAPDSTSAMYRSVVSNNMQAIAEQFPIQAYNRDTTGVVIDVTDFVNSDNNIIWFENRKAREVAGIGTMEREKSFVKYVRTYPENLEIRALKTYTAGQNPKASNYTLELNSSWRLLPKQPMRPRLQDSRVGYFVVGHRDFDTNPQGVTDAIYATRWRLEPRPEDRERYLAGELVEPQKSIVFYIDPTTPKKWVPYLIQGVNDWNVAFEAAGFKNAIRAEEAPQDSTWDIQSANVNAILYCPSAVANAMGPSIADPRSGEILESHVFWYHNVMSTLKQWYLVQCGAVDPRAHQPQLDDELMGQLIRFVSSHEIGHTLGLRHNMGSSATVPVEKLRNKTWVEQHGHTPSIMDYARFNYVAQPGDNIGPAGLFPRIGDYDRWAIYWGYRWRPECKDEREEQKLLTKLVTDTLRLNHRLWFGSEMEPFDPRCQAECLGDNAIKASTYGIKNLKRILPHLAEWYVEEGKDFTNLENALKGVFSQYSLYLGHVLKSVGGVYHNDIRGGDKEPMYQHVDRATQRASMDFITQQCLKTPLWLNEQSCFSKLKYNFGEEMARLQRDLLNGLIMRNRLSNLMNAELENRNAYTLTEFFQDLNRGVLAELYNGQNVDFYRRNLQKMFVSRLLEQAYAAQGAGETATYGYVHHLSDMQPALDSEVQAVKRLCDTALSRSGLNAATRAHLQDLRQKITDQQRSVYVRK